MGGGVSAAPPLAVSVVSPRSHVISTKRSLHEVLSGARGEILRVLAHTSPYCGYYLSVKNAYALPTKISRQARNDAVGGDGGTPRLHKTKLTNPAQYVARGNIVY